MSTMVGEEAGLVVTADAAGRGHKEIKKTGLINAFFQPVKIKQVTETRLGDEISLNTKNESSQATESSICVNQTKTAIVQEPEASCLISIGDGQTSKKKTSSLPGKGISLQAASQEDLAKPKRTKPKWSVTCAVRKNSSGSDFEDDGKSAFDTKTRQVQKSGKKKAKNGSRSNSRNSQETEGNVLEFNDNRDKESETFHVEKSDLSTQVIEKPVEQHTEKIKSHTESKALEKYEKPNQTRTSAFDVLMKSQRAQKLEDQGTETLLVEASDTAIASSDNKSEISGSCEIVDNKETLQSKVPASTGDSSSETNAFDFLMRKGRLGKSPSGMDSQLESDLESQVLENPESSSKQKSKKKTFEFKLSIRASKKKDTEFSLESDCASSDVVNCEEQSNSKRKRKTRKVKTAGSELVESGSDESFVSEKCEEVVEVSKSTRGRKKMKGKSKVNNEEDQADVSLLEVAVAKESNKSARKGRKSGRKSTPVTEKVTGSVVANEGADVDKIDCQPMEKAQIRGKRTKQQRKDNESTPTEIKDKKVQKPNKKMKIDVTSLSQESLAAECQETSVCDSSNTEDADRINRKGGKKKEKVLPSESLSSTDGQNTAGSKNNKEDSDIHHKETSLCTEPKALASIFLKKKPAPSKPETEEQCPTMTGELVLSSTESSVVTLVNATNKCSTSDLDSSPCKAKSAAEQEAANRAFKALFTGVCSQKMLPTSTAAEARPAPWPLVSHVIQRDEVVSLGVNFWSLPWPPGEYHKSDDFSPSLSLDDLFTSTSLSLEDRVMFCGNKQEQKEQPLCDLKKLESETTQQNFAEAVTKKVLLELALFYPGVPLRKLYKRYASKLLKHKESSVAVESKQVAAENTVPVSDRKSNPKPFDDNEEKHDLVSRKKGKVKRKMSSDGGVSKEKKVARKSEQPPAVSLPREGQDLLMDQSVNKSCKKRGREDENDQGQGQDTKGRRLSTRLQKKMSLECKSVNDDLEQVEATSNRKKRRRTSDHQKDVNETSESCKPTESDVHVPVTSNKEKNSVEGFVNDTLWTDLFRPVHSTEVMANASAVSKLRSWLEEWKVKREKTLRKELQLQKRLLAKEKGKSTSSSQASSHTLEWWDDDSDSDFQMSDNASDDSDTEGVGLNTAMFISGPTGVGKTAMVYACAEELGYKVFEVNSSSKRSGKHILSQLEEATQSHLVINKGPTPQSSFAGVFNKPVDNSSPPSGPLSAFFNTNANASDTKTKKGEKGKKKQKMKEKKKDESKGKGRSILKQPPPAVNDDTESCSSLSSKAASLILFEEVDVIFEEDKSFWMAVNSFMQNAKCPIVLISTESQVSCEGRYEQINVKPPSINLLAAHLQLVALTNNMFVNPEDLKSLVTQNNCDIRKSFLALQFWSASGGGVKMPYERPSSLRDKDVADKHPKPQVVSAICNSSIDHGKADITSSQDVLQIEPPVTSGILNDDGEESMFLSLSDWHVIKNRGTRRSSRTTQRGSLQQTEDDNNSDSDFCDPKKKTLVCTDGTTDSIFEITDTNDSQPVSSADKKPEESPQLPLMDSLLFESSHGLLNCVADPTVGSLSVLENKKKPGDIVEDCAHSSKLHLTHFTQGLDVNLVQANLSDLIPLFADSSTSSAQTKHDSPLVEGSNAALPITEHIEFRSGSIFSDKSLFDDGMEESGNNVEHDSVMETNQMTEKESEDTKARPVPSSQDSTDTGFSESQPKEEIGKVGRGQGDGERTEDSAEKGRKLARKKPSNEERCCTKALEIFEQFAENMSFSDAFCPRLSISNTQSTSAEFGWCDAALKPGLTDEHVTVQDCSEWLARDARASLRGALEVANLESCRVKVNSLVEDLKQIENSTQDENSSTTLESEQYDFKFLSEDLPHRDSNAVVCFDELTRTQKSSIASCRKLHCSLCSCIPALYHCDHRCIASDYIPTFRLLCHSERLREAANIKRRFLHYLDLNSFPLSRSTIEALADSYLAQ